MTSDLIRTGIEKTDSGNEKNDLTNEDIKGYEKSQQQAKNIQKYIQKSKKKNFFHAYLLGLLLQHTEHSSTLNIITQLLEKNEDVEKIFWISAPIVIGNGERIEKVIDKQFSEKITQHKNFNFVATDYTINGYIQYLKQIAQETFSALDNPQTYYDSLFLTYISEIIRSYNIENIQSISEGKKNLENTVIETLGEI